MLRFDVPFVPEESYTDFLRENASRVYSLYFSLYSPNALDARARFETKSAGDLAALISRVPGVKKYALLNSRFNHPAWYFDPQACAGAAEALQILLDENCLDGVVFGDFYQLQALSDAAPKLCSRLEAVPSVNFMPDSLEKVRALVAEIRRTNFQAPQKIVLEPGFKPEYDQAEKTFRPNQEAFPGNPH